MAKFSNSIVLFLALALVAVQVNARNVPSNAMAGLNDQKNFVTYGGVGGYSRIGANGMPNGGVGSVGGIIGLHGTGGGGGLVGVGIGGGAGAGGVGGGVAGVGTGTGGGVIYFP